MAAAPSRKRPLKARTGRPKKRTRRKRSNIRVRTAEEFFAQSEEFQTDWDGMLRVLKRMRSDRRLSVKKAARKENVDAQTVIDLADQALRRRSNRSYRATKTDSLFRPMKILTSKGPVEFFPRRPQDATTVGRYWNAVGKAAYGDYSELRKFNKRFVRDRDGNKFSFITEPDELHRLGSAGVLSFESLYARST